MIRRARFQNYKSLRDVEIDFEPLTILIGPNDSGKTSILEALHVPTQTSVASVGVGDALGGIRSTAAVSWNGKDEPLHFFLETDRVDEVSYELEVRGGGFVKDRLQVGPRTVGRLMHQSATDGANGLAYSEAGDTTLRILRDRGRPSPLHEFVVPSEKLYTSPIYRLDPRAMRRSSVPGETEVLDPDGGNLAAILDSIITGPDREATDTLNREIGSLIRFLRSVSVRAVGKQKPGAKTVNFVPSGANAPVIPCELASDGAMLVAGFLALSLSTNAQTLLIEEPENGVHPKLLEQILNVLRRIALSHGKQVIVTTHNPLLLNFASPNEIRIVMRSEDTGTFVTPMSKIPGIEDDLKEFGPGELWYLLGERALVDRKPS